MCGCDKSRIHKYMYVRTNAAKGTPSLEAFQGKASPADDLFQSLDPGGGGGWLASMVS